MRPRTFVYIDGFNFYYGSVRRTPYRWLNLLRSEKVRGHVFVLRFPIRDSTAGLAPAPSWLEVDWTLSHFSRGSRSESCEAYRRFVADGRGAGYKPWESLIGQI